MSSASRSTREDIDLVPHEPPAEPPARLEPVDRLSQHPDIVREALPRDLAQEETSALRRISPRRNRWPELAEIDSRVAELEQRAARVREELQRLTQERNVAPDRDAEALGRWIGKGEKGRKPEPTAPELDRRIEELERERDALVRATDTELERKSEFVAKHRKKLVRDADAHAHKLRKRYEQLVDELAETRAELSDARATAIWASVYPDRSAGATPPTTLAGGVRRVLERANVTSQTNPEQVFDLLRADAEWLANVVSREQGEAMGLRRPDQAVWTGTPEAQEANRRDQEKARKRYTELWGEPPSEFGLIEG